MKTILKKTIVTIGVFFCFYSCENFIEVEVPNSQLTGLTVFEDNATATAALSDIYARVRNEGMVTGTLFGISFLMANYADELTFYGTNTLFESFNNHTLIPSNLFLGALWNSSYGQLYAINSLIEGVENSSNLKQNEKNVLIGEALFLRAYIHFYLSNCFGEVPYINTTNYLQNTTVSRNSMEEINQNIINDLKEAEALVPNNYPSNERVRANKFVVKAMLARVNLYLKNWSEAESYATQVINNTTYTWETNIQNVFLKENPGIIWSLHPGFAGLNTNDARAFIFSSGPPIKPALSIDFINSFELNDTRKQNWVRAISRNNQTWYHAYKYKKTLNSGTSAEYTILFRLAEQYLIRAEARAELNNISQALLDLNKVRSRAGIPQSIANSKETIVEAIIQERRVELFTEQGHRWFDLKRTGRAENVLSPIKPNWKNTDLILPIPESELLLNKNLLPQNPGY